jgi:sugar phosphate isomerase/epimerase
MDTESVSRRAWLRGLAAVGAVATICRPATSNAAATHSLDKIGLQLFSLREVFAANPVETLTRVRRIGYQQVEIAELANNSPKALRLLLDDLGLEAPSLHVSLDRLLNAPGQAMEEANILGCRYVVLPWVSEEWRRKTDAWRQIAAVCNHAAEAARAAGLLFAYHNHSYEFAVADGRSGYDILLAETDPALVFLEIDVYWAAYSGVDVVALLKAHAKRFRLIHLKDMARDRTITAAGAGTLDFAAILRQGDTAGLAYYYVEYDNPPPPYFPAVAASYRYLRALRY